MGIAVNYAAVMGIREDANLTTEEYGTLSWIFYLGFLFCQFPHAYFLQRLPSAKYLGNAPPSHPSLPSKEN